MDTFQTRFLSRLDRSKRHRAGLPGENEASLPDPVKTIQGQVHPRRNEPCPCGSGKKYKKCCITGS